MVPKAAQLFMNDGATDQAYINVRDEVSPEAAVCRRFSEELWQQYQPYADRDFRSSMRSAFHARFWEMYLTCAVLEHKDKQGYTVECPKPGPDILVTAEGRKVWVEAIIATNGQLGKLDSISDPLLRPPGFDGKVVAYKVPDAELVLRYAAAIAEKHQRYLHYRDRGIIAEQDAYVIALNSSALYHRWDAEMPRVLKALYPLGAWGVAIDRNTFEVVDARHEYRPAIVKSTGGAVSTEIFVDPQYSGISAVLHSNADAWRTQRPLGSDFLVAHNPLATNQVPRGFLPAVRECWATPDGQGGYEVSYTET